MEFSKSNSCVSSPCKTASYAAYLDIHRLSLSTKRFCCPSSLVGAGSSLVGAGNWFRTPSFAFVNPNSSGFPPPHNPQNLSWLYVYSPLGGLFTGDIHHLIERSSKSFNGIQFKFWHRETDETLEVKRWRPTQTVKHSRGGPRCKPKVLACFGRSSGRSGRAFLERQARQHLHPHPRLRSQVRHGRSNLRSLKAK